MDDGHEGCYERDAVLAAAVRVLRGDARLQIRAQCAGAPQGARALACRPVDDGGAFAHEAGWRTAVRFERGLADTRGGRPAALNGVS